MEGLHLLELGSRRVSGGRIAKGVNMRLALLCNELQRAPFLINHDVASKWTWRSLSFEIRT
jgi:hypothetical protein